jgi:hypothetical protein
VRADRNQRCILFTATTALIATLAATAFLFAALVAAAFLFATALAAALAVAVLVLIFIWCHNILILKS